jgi:type II secretory pathway component PulF
MNIPTFILGPACIVAGLLLTFVFPIQRGRFQNQVWDLITLALFIAGAWWIGYWDALSNLGVGLIVGIVAVIIRDFRLWKVRFRDQVYRRTSPRYWYGRAYNMWGRRRRRY